MEHHHPTLLSSSGHPSAASSVSKYRTRKTALFSYGGRAEGNRGERKGEEAQREREERESKRREKARGDRCGCMSFSLLLLLLPLSSSPSPSHRRSAQEPPMAQRPSPVDGVAQRPRFSRSLLRCSSPCGRRSCRSPLIVSRALFFPRAAALCLLPALSLPPACSPSARARCLARCTRTPPETHAGVGVIPKAASSREHSASQALPLFLSPLRLGLFLSLYSKQRATHPHPHTHTPQRSAVPAALFRRARHAVESPTCDHRVAI